VPPPGPLLPAAPAAARAQPRARPTGSGRALRVQSAARQQRQGHIIGIQSASNRQHDDCNAGCLHNLHLQNERLADLAVLCSPAGMLNLVQLCTNTRKHMGDLCLATCVAPVSVDAGEPVVLMGLANAPEAPCSSKSRCVL